MTGRSDSPGGASGSGAQRWAGAAGFCRDCGAPAGEAGSRCAHCGSPRLVRDPELFSLSIAHVDCDAFFANIEKRDNPALRDEPVIVGGGRRGVVAAACYVARTFGIHSAMPVSRAKRLCPSLTVIRPDHDKYTREGLKIRAIMRRFTPLVEPLSIDEAFLDLSGTERLHGAPPAVSLARLARQVLEETGLSISIGLSFNKFLAKMASDLDKPRGYAVISRARALPFLDGLDVRDLWGVGPAAAKALARHGVRTVPQLRARERGWLIAHFGKLGAHLHDLAHARDERPVSVTHETKSISNETTFEDDIRDPRALEAILWRLSKKVMRRALAKGLAGHTVTLKLRKSDFTTRTASTRMDEPTLLASRIHDAARALLARIHDGAPCRLIGVGISNLEEVSEETLAASLDERAARKARADLAAERLRRKFGDDTIDKGLGFRTKT